MLKLEYDNLYKFIASIGMFLIAVPVFVVYYVINMNDQLLIRKDAYCTLTQESICFLQRRNQALILILNILPYVCIIAVVLGIFLLIYAYYKWNKIQVELDRQLITKTQIQLKSLEKLSPSEHIDNINAEIEENLDDKTKANKLTLGEVKEMYMNMVGVENLCYEYILRKKQDAYDIQQNIKVGGKQYDIIARSKKDSKDILYEVKYWKDKKTFGKIKTVVEKEKDKITTYELIEQRTTYDKILIVLPDDVYEETVSMHKTLKKAGTENIEVCIFRFSDIDKEY